MISEDHPLKLKLSGLELATRVRFTKSDAKVPVSGLCNLPPELLLNLQTSNQDGLWVREDLLHFGADMWAVGCVMFTLLAGYAPFDEGGVLPTLFRIFKTFGTPSHLDLIGQGSFQELA